MSSSPGEPLHVVRLPLGGPHEAQELQRGHGLREPRLLPQLSLARRLFLDLAVLDLVRPVRPVFSGGDGDPALHPVVEVDEAPALALQLVGHAQVGQRRIDRTFLGRRGTELGYHLSVKKRSRYFR